MQKIYILIHCAFIFFHQFVLEKNVTYNNSTTGYSTKLYMGYVYIAIFGELLNKYTPFYQLQKRVLERIIKDMQNSVFYTQNWQSLNLR